MPLEQVGASVVVVAHQFNPSVISEVWLTRNELLRVEDRQEGCVFTDVFVNLRSSQYSLLVTPDQLQFAPGGEPEAQRDLILSKVGKMIALLPHVPYHAAGLNFVWAFDPEPETVPTATRRLFFAHGRPFFRHFDTPDAQFGSYLSKSVLGCRLKLDIKPVTVTQVDSTADRARPVVHLAFNYHLDVLGHDDPVARIRQLLGQWDEAKQEAERIAHDSENLR
jgi:hypothetical protein